MFTGLVSEVGLVTAATREGELLTLVIEAPATTAELAIGDSVSVSGVCLTATRADGDSFECEAMGETLRRTRLGDLDAGSHVNLELAARLSDRLGGHLVQGHVDTVGEVVGLDPRADATRVTVRIEEQLMRYLVEKGSVAVEGVSLTVSHAGTDTFSFVLIPHTLQSTTLGSLHAGSRVNVEVDVIAKYVERLALAGRND